MSVYYYNGAKILAPFTVISNEPMYDADSVSLRKQRASQDVQRWEIEFKTILETDDQATALVNSVVDRDTSTTMVMPQLPGPDSTFNVNVETVSINSTGNVGDSTVELNETGISGTLPKGYFVKFSNHDKLYLVTADFAFSGAGTGNLSIYPSLRSEVTNLDSVKLGSLAVFSYYRDISNLNGITFTDGVLSEQGSVRLVEAL